MLTLVTTSPANGASNILPTAAIQFVFSEAINTATFTNGMIYIKDKNGNEVTFSSAFSSDGMTLTITPTNPLNVGTYYTVYFNPTDLLSGKTLAATNGDVITQSMYFDFYTQAVTASDVATVPNSYTDPMFTTPFKLSSTIRYEGQSALTSLALTGSFTLNFNQNISTNSPTPLANITAETYQGVSYDPQATITISANRLIVTPKAMQPNSRIYINVPSTLTGADGSTLPDDVNTYTYTALSPQPFSPSRLLARLGAESEYFDNAQIYEVGLEAMLTAGAWANVDFTQYQEGQITPQLSLAFTYLAMGILLTNKYLNAAIYNNTQITIDITTYRYTGLPGDLGAAYTKLGIDLLRGMFPIAPSVNKHAIRVFRARWSYNTTFDKPGVNRNDSPSPFIYPF